MFLFKVHSVVRGSVFQSGSLGILEGIEKFLGETFLPANSASVQETIKKETFGLAEVNKLKEAIENSSNSTQQTLQAAGLISKHILKDPKNIFPMVNVFSSAKKESLLILDFMSKQKVFYPILHLILETLKKERDSRSLDEFIEVLSESESITYVHCFIEERFADNKIVTEKTNSTALEYAIKNNYELGQIKDKETILFFDGGSVILSGKDFSDAVGEYVFIKRDKQNLIELKDQNLKELQWKNQYASEEQWIFSKSSKGIISAVLLESNKKYYLEAKEFLAGSETAVSFLKQEGLYIPFSNKNELFYLVTDKRKNIFAIQNGERISLFDVKNYPLSNWQEEVMVSLRYSVSDQYRSHRESNPSIFERINNKLDSIVGFATAYFTLSSFAAFATSFFLNLGQALLTGAFFPLILLAGIFLYIWIDDKYIPYKKPKKLQKQLDVIDKEAMDFYLEYHNKN